MLKYISLNDYECHWFAWILINTLNSIKYAWKIPYGFIFPGDIPLNDIVSLVFQWSNIVSNWICLGFLLLHFSYVVFFFGYSSITQHSLYSSHSDLILNDEKCHFSLCYLVKSHCISLNMNWIIPTASLLLNWYSFEWLSMSLTLCFQVKLHYIQLNMHWIPIDFLLLCWYSIGCSSIS